MKKSIITILVILGTFNKVQASTAVPWVNNGGSTIQPVQFNGVNQNLSVPALGGNNVRCLQTDNSGNITDANSACGSGGGGSSGGTWSTTTSAVPGELINYSNNNTDIVTVGGSSTSTALFIFDPNSQIGYIKGQLGIGTKSPTTQLDVFGIETIRDHSVSSYYTATSTVASTFPYASTTALTVSGNSFLGTVSSGLWNGTTIGAGFGGTGQLSYTTGDMLYATGATALSKLGIGASSTVLITNGTAPFWQKLATSQLTNDSGFLTSVSVNSPLGGNGTSGSPLTCTTCNTSNASVSSVATNNGLTGGTITTTGTIGLDISKIVNGALLMYNGSQLQATGTQPLTVGYLIATTTTATSSLPNILTTNLAVNGASAGCAQFNAGGEIGSSGVACGSGSGGSSFAWPFTPVAGGNATSSLLYLYGGLYDLGSTTIQYASTTVISASGQIYDSALSQANCVQAGANGLLTTTPNACGAGTVNGSIAGNLAWYASAGTAVSGTSTSPLTVGYLIATSTTATSTFQGLVAALAGGSVGIGTTTPGNASALGVNGNAIVGASLSAGAYNGAGLFSCNSAANALTWNAGQFGCNTISGSGTVNSGVAGEIPWYASSGTAVTGSSTANLTMGYYIATSTTATSTLPNISSTNISIAGAAAGCAQVNAGGVLGSTGSACGSGGGGGNSFAFPFTPVAGGNSTTSLMYDYGGLFDLGSTTIQFASSTAVTVSGSLYANNNNVASDATTGTTSVSNLSTGNLNFVPDAGVVSLVDLPILSATNNTTESYQATIGGTNVTTWYAQSNGSSAAKNLAFGIGTTSPYTSLSVTALNSSGDILNVATSSSGSLYSIDYAGHHFYDGSKPSCDASCIFLYGNDNVFYVKAGTAITSTVITFASSWNGLWGPVCSVSDGSAVTTFVDASSTPTTVTLTPLSALTGTILGVQCQGVRQTH